jgi:hypothetical protein
MFPQRPIGWPITSIEAAPAPQPPGGVAPLRHDLALARYLEQRAAHGAPALCELGTWAALRRIFRRMAGKGWGASLVSHPGRHATP